MDEEIKNEQVETPETNYIELIKQVKNNSVSKDEYNRVLQQNKQLAESLMYTQPEESTDSKVTYSEDEIQRLREKLAKQNSGITNLEYITTMLDLRDAIMANGGNDPFVGNNHQNPPDDYDYEAAQNVADGLRQIVDYCDGNAALFNSELKRCCK